LDRPCLAAISELQGLARRDAMQCVIHYKELLARVRAARAAFARGEAIIKVGPAKKKPMAAKKKEIEDDLKRKKEAKEAKEKAARRAANGGRLTAEELGRGGVENKPSNRK
jgi:hypothetical protein